MQKEIQAGLQELNIEATQEQIEKIEQFVQLLLKWNKTYNLTALKTKEEIIPLHIFDSLSVLPYVESAKQVLDVGSGAGLPGIPLAIFLPNTQINMLDSNGKKTRFIQQAIIQLKLENCTVHQSRIEDFKPGQEFDTIITRAFAEIQDTINKLKHFSTKNVRLMFMKAKNVERELENLSTDLQVKNIALKVPGLEADRSLVIISKIQMN